jgi:hypothetical protein
VAVCAAVLGGTLGTVTPVEGLGRQAVRRWESGVGARAGDDTARPSDEWDGRDPAA